MSLIAVDYMVWGAQKREMTLLRCIVLASMWILCIE